jgi:hypothetical protein
MGAGTVKTNLDFAHAFALMLAWPSTLSRIGRSWNMITAEKNGSFNFYERPSQPCYGEMRPYATINHKPGFDGEKDLLPVSQRAVRMPGDLYAQFPEGTPVALSVAIPHANADQTKLLEEIILNPKLSPWRSVLKGVELIYKDKIITGIVIKDTKIDPTVMVCMFRKINSIHSVTIADIRKHFPDVNLTAAYVLGQAMMGDCSKFVISAQIDYGPWSGQKQDWSAIMNGTPYDYTDGGTFYQRYAYNRPKIDYIWYDPEQKNNVMLPHNQGGLNEVKANLDYLTSLVKVE